MAENLDIADLQRRLEEAPWTFDFFQAVRRLECARPQIPSVGESLSVDDDALRFAQQPSLAFAASTLQAFSIRADGLPPQMFVNFMGLLGPNGPMPLFLTDRARQREFNFRDPTLSRFLNIFNNRMIALFYRAWATNQQTVSFERRGRVATRGRDADRWGTYVGSFFGMGNESFIGRDAVDDIAKLHFSGRLSAPTKNAEGLREIVEDYFGVATQLAQFVGRWIDIPGPDRLRLGESRRTGLIGFNGTAIVGSTVWDCQSKFRLRLGPMKLGQYDRLLPGGDSLRRLLAWVRNYVGEQFDFDVSLVLEAREVPQVSLGKLGRLGWTTWLKSQPRTTDAADLTLQPRAMAG